MTRHATRPTDPTGPTMPPAIDPRLAPWGVTGLRVALGGVMLAHGLTKVFLFTLPGTVAFFESAGYPGWTAYPVTALEIAGGAMLIAGVYARLAAAALVPVLIGALLGHLPNGWMFTAPNGGWEYVAFLVVALAAQALLGDGALALRPTTLWRGRSTAVDVEPAVATVGTRRAAHTR